MKVTALLCDFADEVNGKLYILGGGWSLIAANRPVPLALAVKIAVPWGQSNRPHDLVIRLIDGEGNPFNGPDGKPVEAAGKFEVGRPPGIASGSDLDTSLALKIGALTFEPGRYVWEIRIDGDAVEEVSFEAVGG